MKKLPKFKSEKQIAGFWDSHSPLDYPGEFTDVINPFKFKSTLLSKKKKTSNSKLAIQNH